MSSNDIDQNVGKNIKNAFEIVVNTYRNLSKLMDKIIIIAQEENDLHLASNVSS